MDWIRATASHSIAANTQWSSSLSAVNWLLWLRASYEHSVGSLGFGPTIPSALTDCMVPTALGGIVYTNTTVSIWDAQRHGYQILGFATRMPILFLTTTCQGRHASPLSTRTRTLNGISPSDASRILHLCAFPAYFYLFPHQLTAKPVAISTSRPWHPLSSASNLKLRKKDSPNSYPKKKMHPRNPHDMLRVSLHGISCMPYHHQIS